MKTSQSPIYLTEDYFKAEGLREWYERKEFAQHISRLQIVWSWGAHQWAVIDKTILRFRVQGRLFKGLVWIAPNGSDLMNVYFTSSRRHANGCYALIERLEDIYLEDLLSVLDGKIETPE